MSKPVYNVGDLPDPKTDPEFWTFLKDPKYKININFLILNTIRTAKNVASLDDNQCRSYLSKLSGLQELLDLPEFFEQQAGEEEPLERDHFNELEK